MIKAKEYGYALYELAQEDGIANEIKADFSEVADLLENNQSFVRLLSNPRITKTERIQIVDEIFGTKIQPYLLYLIKIFTENREVDKLPLVYQEYEHKYYDDRNILPVTVTSAVELNPSQVINITKKLEGLTNKSIVLKNRIDKDCIGGIRVEYRGQMIDSSIKNRFRKLQHDIKNADYSKAEV